MRCCGSRPTSQPVRPCDRRRISSTQGCSLQDDATCEARQRAGSCISSTSDDTDFSDKEYQQLQCASAWRDTIFRMELEIVAQREQHESLVEQRLEHIGVQERQLRSRDGALRTCRDLPLGPLQLANVDGEGMHTKDMLHPAKCSADDAPVSSTCADESMLKLGQQPEAGQYRREFSRDFNVPLRGNLFERGLPCSLFCATPQSRQQLNSAARLLLLPSRGWQPLRQRHDKDQVVVAHALAVVKKMFLPPAPIDGSTGFKSFNPHTRLSRWLKARLVRLCGLQHEQMQKLDNKHSLSCARKQVTLACSIYPWLDRSFRDMPYNQATTPVCAPNVLSPLAVLLASFWSPSALEIESGAAASSSSDALCRPDLVEVFLPCFPCFASFFCFFSLRACCRRQWLSCSSSLVWHS